MKSFFRSILKRTAAHRSLSPSRAAAWLRFLSADGDILLFSYGDRLLLHRVCAVKDGELWFMGDAHTYSEGPVRQQAVLARCDSAVRDGKLVSRRNTLWKFYEHLWAEKPEARNHLLKAAGIIKKK